MAEIKFKGFVQKHDNPKAPWTIVEGHRKKDAADNWVTESRTYHRVWLPRGVDELRVDELVEVTGTQKNKPYEDAEGKKRDSFVVYADKVESVGSARSPQVSSASTDPYNDETPF